MENMSKKIAEIVCISHLDDGSSPHPRCLSALPQNIEELIMKFNTQESQIQFLENSNKN